MKKYRITIWAIVFVARLSAQELDIFHGLVLNDFYLAPAYRGLYYNYYDSGRGLSSGAGFHFGWRPRLGSRAELRFQQYRGGFRANTNGLGGGTTFKATVHTQELSLTLYPVQLIRIEQYFEFGAGLTMSYILREYLNGDSYLINGTTTTASPIYAEKPDFSNSFGFGLSLRLAGVFPLEKGWQLVTQYGLYAGLTQRFSHYARGTSNVLNLFELGVRKKLYP